MMEVIQCGTEVKTKIESIKAIITASTIRFDKVQYELSYFFDGEYRTCWLHEKEFDIINGKRNTIGFKNIGIV